jgi:hypothetical protein
MGPMGCGSTGANPGVACGIVSGGRPASHHTASDCQLIVGEAEQETYSKHLNPE